jgi:hypothetical protein
MSADDGSAESLDLTEGDVGEAASEGGPGDLDKGRGRSELRVDGVDAGGGEDLDGKILEAGAAVKLAGRCHPLGALGGCMRCSYLARA